MYYLQQNDDNSNSHNASYHDYNNISNINNEQKPLMHTYSNDISCL